MTEYDEKNLIEMSFNVTQDLSRENRRRNFICPVCHIKRIAKARTGEPHEWLHTGCICTYNWLSAHGKLEATIPMNFRGTGRFVG